LEETPGIPFKIIGDGPQLGELKQKVVAKNLRNIEFLGPKWGDELDEILYKARYVVVPSVWHENFPYVILQSFAAGVPVIGSNLGGIPELLRDDRGMIFNLESIESLSNCILKMNEDMERRELYKRNATKYLSENFNDQVFYQSLLKNYRSVLS
jgi:glycosyltransferase involved in cell wall biosynthesis